VQTELLNKLLHRDLVDPHHKTNLHLHYDMSTDDSAATSNGPTPSPQSLFSRALTTTFQPKDPHLHKELSVTRLLEKKLRWVTLGGQYDWTSKEYPRERPPPFPSDVAGALRTLFPCVKPQAAILNLYSPGDTLSVHRDVSEECDSGLVSLSFGCEAVFIVGNEDGTKTATIRLRSGDALLMFRPSRFAWHAVPKVLAGTCPDWLQDWPVVGGEGSNYAQWKGWMAGKRINLNVRQMREQDK
jgi:DNA alkylation damage repair protein AlkB